MTLAEVSCCLNTKDRIYPKEVLDHLLPYGFGEIIIETGSDSPFGKYEAINKAKFDIIFYQDDDAIVPVEKLFENYQPDIINVLMKPSHIEAYKDKRMTMGLGWGCLFPKSMLKSLDKWREKWGEDDIFKRETERILTEINYPQNRISADIVDLPSAWNPDRLWRQPNHHDYLPIVEERSRML